MTNDHCSRERTAGRDAAGFWLKLDGAPFVQNQKEIYLMRISRTRLTASLTVLCTLALAPPALANSSPAEITHAVDGGVAYVKSQQAANGSWEGFGSEWLLTSLAAAGVPPAGVKREADATNARTYYRELIGDTATWPGSEAPVTDFDTAALAAYAAGIDPARVSPTQNLIAQILAHYRPSDPGAYGSAELFNGTAFSLMALADAKTREGAQRVPQVLLEKSIEVVRRNQHTDGGWNYLAAEGDTKALEAPAEVEFTGATIAALCGAGVPASDPAIKSALSFLKAEQAAEPAGSGAFESEFGVNTDSTAWAVEGLNACGINPQGGEFTTLRGRTPIDFLISQQLPEGGFQYEAEEGESNLYSSQDAVRALAGAGFTAAPSKAKGQKLWLYEKKFTASDTTELGLIINTGSSPLQVCSVSLTPTSTKVTLASVLEAAETSATPAGCVSGFTPTSGKGAITSVDDSPNPPQASWQVSIDGGAEKQATRKTPIGIGDTIYLKEA
jgi:hypothetical protein